MRASAERRNWLARLKQTNARRGRPIGKREKRKKARPAAKADLEVDVHAVPKGPAAMNRSIPTIRIGVRWKAWPSRWVLCGKEANASSKRIGRALSLKCRFANN